MIPFSAGPCFPSLGLSREISARIHLSVSAEIFLQEGAEKAMIFLSHHSLQIVTANVVPCYDMGSTIEVVISLASVYSSSDRRHLTDFEF